MATSPSSMLSASSFVGSIAVNTHVGYAWTGYGNLSLVKQSLDYLGVDTVRDALTTLPQAQPVLKALAAAGYKFDFIVSSSLPAAGTAAMKGYIETLRAFEAAYPDAIVALEGLNEANIQAFSYNGSSTVQAAGDFQKAFYTAVKAETSLKDIPVYNLTLGHNSQIDYKALGDLTAYSDYANAHAYVSTNTTVSAALNTSLKLAVGGSTGDPKVITETGYTTLEKTADVGANQAAQAKSILNTLVTAFQQGVEKTYLYELLDRGNDPAKTNKEAHFGLFEADGTPKLAATAIHNLTTILADDGTGGKSPTQALGYTLSGLPSNGGSMVLGKSNGAYDLVVWAEPKVWNDATDTEISNPTQTVTVRFPATQAKVVVYDPLLGKTPIASYTNVGEIKLPISDHPLIVEIGGTGLQGPPVDTTPANLVGTAAQIAVQLDALSKSDKLQTITLTDTKVLPMASEATMRDVIANDQAALAKIKGGYQFSLTQTAPTWSKTEIFDAAGKSVSVTSAGIKNGIVFTQQTKTADGTLDTTNFSATGAKANRNVVKTDGSKETFSYNIKNQDYVTEHSIYTKTGELQRFERLRADDSLSFAEVRSGGTKTATWYDAKGVPTKSAFFALDGHTETTVYVAGKPSRLFVENKDGTGSNTSYDIKNQLYVTETQTVGKDGKVTDVLRINADGSKQYHWAKAADGSTLTETFSSKGAPVSSVAKNADGSTVTQTFTNGKLTQEVVKKADGYQSITNLADGIKTAVYITRADGAKETQIFDAKGALSKVALIGTDGHTETTVYVDGKPSRLFVEYKDGSGSNTSYNIKNQPYVTETQTVGRDGKVTDVLRLNSDGSSQYHWSKKADGSTLTETFDSKGARLSTVASGADGTLTTQTFAGGKPTQEVVKKADGYQSITNYTDGIKTSAYVTQASGAKETQIFDAKGVLTKSALTTVDGTTQTVIYTDGKPSRLFVENKDGSGSNTTYGIKNQLYVTETQTVGKDGNVTDVLRLNSDGSSQYHWAKKADGSTLTETFNAKGVPVSTVAKAVDGTTTTRTFGSDGKPTQEVVKKTDGYQSITNYADGLKTSIYITKADGAKETQIFDAKGILTKTALIGADGHTETTVYADGQPSRLFIAYKDGSGSNTSYNIKNQLYVTETQTVGKDGKVTDVLRLNTDGSKQYHWSVDAAGTKTTVSYDGTGGKVTDVRQYADGSSDVFKFVLANQPGVSQYERYDTSKTLVVLDVTAADQTHKITVKGMGLTIDSGRGDDVVSLAGKDTFVFRGGADKVTNFQADDVSPNHARIQIEKVMASSFADLHLTQTGADTLVAINDHDTILLKNVNKTQVNAADFLFV